MLEDLIGRPLDEGDVLSNANTVIYLGRVREGNRLGRAMYIAKRRGSLQRRNFALPHRRRGPEARSKSCVESQRDSILQPRVARNELPWVTNDHGVTIL